MSDTERADGRAGRSDRLSPRCASILRIRPFRRLWLVLGVASLGDWLGLLATVDLRRRTGHRLAPPRAPRSAGVIAVRLLPALVLGPIAGVFADRFDRRYTMVICDLLRFVLFASIPVVALLITDSGAVVVGWAAIATFLIESITMAWLPAKDASVPNLLPRARLETANQLTLATTYGITPVAGGAAAGRADQRACPACTRRPAQSFLDPTTFSLYFIALTRLATALRGVLRDQGDQRPARSRPARQAGRAPRVRRRLDVRRQDPAGARPGARHPRRVRRRRHGGRHAPSSTPTRSAAATPPSTCSSR